MKKKEFSQKAMEYLDDLRTCSRDEAMQKLKAVRLMKTAVKKKETRSPKVAKATKLAGMVGGDFLKRLQKEDLI